MPQELASFVARYFQIPLNYHHELRRLPLARAHLALLMRGRPLRAVLVDGSLVEAARLQLLLDLRPHLAEVAQVPRHQLELVPCVPGFDTILV